MSILLGLILIVLGLLAASTVVGNLSDDLAEAIEQHLRPVQGWLGVAGFVAGALFLVQMLLSVASLETAGIATMIASFLGPVLLTATGFLMGFSTLVGLIGSGDAEEKALEVYQALSPYQVALGMASIGVGVWVILV